MIPRIETPQQRRKRRRRIFALIVLTLLLFGLGWSGYQTYRLILPDVEVLKNRYPIPPDMTWTSKRPAGWIPLSQIPRHVVGAVIVSEDWAFYQHQGYDWNQIQEVLEESWREKRLTRGASTITQQVAKNVFLSHERSIWRKLRELALAVQLEEQLSKSRILETYFNVVEWGKDLYGIRAAASTYFGKHPSELNPAEGAFLAMLLPNPKRYAQSFQQKQLTPYARRTLRSILSKMRQAHYLDGDQYDQIIQAGLPFDSAPVASPGHSQPADEPSPGLMDLIREALQTEG